MHGDLVLVDRDILLSELRQVFDEKTSETLLSVLDKVVAQVKDSGVTREDFSELKEIVARLATRMDELAARMDQLTIRMDQLTATVNELVEAQKRSEERLEKVEGRLGRIEATLETLIQTQQSTDRRLEQLSKQVGGLSDSFGGDIEDIAYIVLHKVLKREFGWEVGVLQRTWQMWDKEPEEVNIFGKAADPSRSGKTIWIVGEAKHNLTSREVSRFVKQLSKARRNLVGEIFPVCFCYRVRPEVQKQVQDAGIHLVFSYGEII